MKTLKYLLYKSSKINYSVNYRNQKNIVLKINSNGINITAPFTANDWEIEGLIYKNISKILYYIENLEKLDLFNISKNNGYIKIFGEKISVNFIDEGKPNPKILEFKIYESQNETIKKMYNKLSKIYFHIFEEIILKHASILSLMPKNIFVKKLLSKWGVCYPKIGKIGLNISLIHYKQNIIEAVAIHEIAHLKYSNHSKDFKRFVNDYYPEYNNCMKILNNKK